jgi:hypothetical protein
MQMTKTVDSTPATMPVTALVVHRHAKVGVAGLEVAHHPIND